MLFVTGGKTAKARWSRGVIRMLVAGVIEVLEAGSDDDDSIFTGERAVALVAVLVSLRSARSVVVVVV